MKIQLRAFWAAVLAAAVYATTGYSQTATVNFSFTDNSDNEDGFHVELAEGEGPFQTAASIDAQTGSGQRVPFSLPIAVGSVYQVRVAAYNAFGVSGYSNSVTVRALPPAAPGDAQQDSVEGIVFENNVIIRGNLQVTGIITHGETEG